MAFPFVAAAAGLGALLTYKGVRDQNKAQKEEAQRDRDFQERMSSTAYQRATADMKLSGINPLLAYAQGGASSPGGRVAKVEDVIGPSVSSAMQLTRMKKEMMMMDAQIFKLGKESIKIVNESNLSQTHNDLLNFGPPGGPSFAARMKEQEFLLKQAQASAMRFSPWLSKLIGTAPLRARPGGQGEGPLRTRKGRRN